MGLGMFSSFDAVEKLPKPGSNRDRLAAYRSQVPEGNSGPWSVECFEVTNDLGLWRLMRDGRGCAPGMYTRLCHDNRGVIMSDTDAELDDLREFRIRAKGRVLIHGLGLGCALQMALTKKEVKSVDVVELDKDVLALVSPHFADKRVTFHHGDCFTFDWPKRKVWDVVWHDVWDEICGDNVPAIRKIERRFADRCNWQGTWAKHLAMRHR